MTVVSNQGIGDELMKRGLVPDNCVNVKIIIGLGGAMVIRYEVFVTPENLAAIGDAMKALAG